MIVLDYTLDVTELVLAMGAAKELRLAFNAKPAGQQAYEMAEKARLRFYKHMHTQAKKYPTRFWHLYKANRVGVPGSELFNMRLRKLNKGQNREVALEMRFEQNTEALRIMSTGTLTGYERQGVRLPSGNSSLGVRTGRSFKSRRGKYRFPDYRDHRKTYFWLNQLEDVEFGRRVVIHPRGGANQKPKKTVTISKTGRKRTKIRKSGYKQREGWLAIPTRGMGMVFAKERTIDYKTWPSYQAFTDEFELYFAEFGTAMKKEFENYVNDNIDDTEEAVQVVSPPRLKKLKEQVGQKKMAGGISGGFNIIYPAPQKPKELREEYMRVWSTHDGF